MTIAKRIKEQITTHFGSSDRSALALHLRRNMVSHAVKTCAPHHGYDLHDDQDLPIIFYYADDSLLIVTQSRVFTALELVE
jgi:hypothetical protein